MFSKENIFGTVFACQVVTGVLGNSLILYFYILNFLHGHREKPIDFILTHLSLINVLLLVTKGIPRTVTLLGIRHFLGDIACKTIVYLDRVFRSLSLCSTSILSSYQAITLSSNSPVCAVLKAKASKHITASFILCWMLSLLTEGAIPIYKITLQNSSRFRNNWNLDYCIFSIYFMNTFNTILLKILYDSVWFGLTTYSSIYIIFLMQKHHKKVLHIRSTNFSPKTCPEIKATNTVVILVNSFICFHLVSSIFFALHKSQISSSWMLHVSAFMSGCFPTFCPIVLISSMSRFSTTCFFSNCRTKPPSSKIASVCKNLLDFPSLA
ncbi:vomeronasal 1 receptor monDomV1R1203 [Monodelphis domestica]|uniref:Vomeronasal type-1 receptor n=1 Tax=Monodelphis domestica TaxID=13616 RepID=A0A5F8HBQ7_MONDO|nr:vomeronasal 1 receptor monDomV1R1203 [Monodelphis domestica]